MLNLLWTATGWLLATYVVGAIIVFLITLFITRRLMEKFALSTIVSGVIALSWPALLALWCVDQGWFDWWFGPAVRPISALPKPTSITLPGDHHQPVIFP